MTRKLAMHTLKREHAHPKNARLCVIRYVGAQPANGQIATYHKGAFFVAATLAPIVLFHI
jgi:hypothetical protein